MSDPAKEQLIETLRKAVSRTSMMAEGLDPQLDLTLKNIRQQIASGADEASVSKILKNAEPMLLAADEARELRAKKLRDTLNDLIDILERLPNYDVPQKQKKDLQTQIRSHWQSIYRWPELTADFLLLAEATLNSAHNTTQKTSLFGRLFQKNTNKDHKPNDTAIVGECAQTLTSLLDNLSLPESFDEQVNDVKRFLSDSKELTFLPKMVAESVNLAMIALGKTQQDLTTYLSQLNTQLASINASIVTSYKNQRSLTNKRQDFSSDLQKQVDATAHAVVTATDLQDLKQVIEQRLDAISVTMSDYQQQMLEQEKLATHSISQLRSKVNRMEKDASALRLNLQQKLAQAMTDCLTNLPNRAAYQDTILPLCQTSHPNSDKRLALAVCDIDHFKTVNDTWGHLAGDKVLRLIPRQIRSALSEADMAFRYGGEEFVILFPYTNAETVKQKAERIRQAVEQMPFNVDGEPVPITVSIGIALLSQESHEMLFARADKCLYQAKEQGRNRVIIDAT